MRILSRSRVYFAARPGCWPGRALPTSGCPQPGRPRSGCARHEPSPDATRIATVRQSCVATDGASWAPAARAASPAPSPRSRQRPQRQPEASRTRPVRNLLSREEGPRRLGVLHQEAVIVDATEEPTGRVEEVPSHHLACRDLRHARQQVEHVLQVFGCRRHAMPLLKSHADRLRARFRLAYVLGAGSCRRLVLPVPLYAILPGVHGGVNLGHVLRLLGRHVLDD